MLHFVALDSGIFCIKNKKFDGHADESYGSFWIYSPKYHAIQKRSIFLELMTGSIPEASMQRKGIQVNIPTAVYYLWLCDW